MQKQFKETAIYKPNEHIRVTVQNTPVTSHETGEILFKQEMTLKVHNGFSSDKLSFADADELKDFLADLQLEDPQQKLPV